MVSEPFAYRHFHSKERLETELAALLLEVLSTATAREPKAVMLSGGSTPRELYRRIASCGERAGDGAYLTVSDERIVPRGSEDANLTMIEAMARGVGVPSQRLVAVEHTLGATPAAKRYHHALEELRRNGVSREVALLGIGGDGHTASIFDLATAREEGELLARPAGEHAGFERVTATAREILSHRRLIFFVAGAGKQEILDALTREPETYPAGIIALRHGAAEVWTDLRRPGGAG
ncbi:MAG: 6-phosphogluconolactonase [Alkalispirochaetaceae bacterium]